MKIGTHNYEAFFLDYHEGMLGAEERAVVLLFVEQHPELQEQFYEFENISITSTDILGFVNKQKLKKQSPINADNIEDYLIRKVEGLLSPQEMAELKSFIVQHPQYARQELLYEKTKLLAPAQIVFENKNELKKIYTHQEVFEFAEGLMNTDFQVEFLSAIKQSKLLANEVALFQKAKLSPDFSIVYPNKKELKRAGVLIPLFAKVLAVAASVAILLGLYFMLNRTESVLQQSQSKMASTGSGKQIKRLDNKNSAKMLSNKFAVEPTTVLVKNKGRVIPIKKSNTEENKDLQPIQSLPETNLIIANTSEPENKMEASITAQNNEVNTNALAATSSNERNNNNKVQLTETLTLKELLALKVKEKILSEEEVKNQKRGGKITKITGVDIASVFAKTLSWATGKRIEVKADYNEEGNVN
jgi:hypothetical protein